MNNYQRLYRHCTFRFIIIILQLIIIFILIRRDLRESSFPRTPLSENNIIQTKPTSEISLTQLDTKYHTSKGQVHRYTRFYEHYLSKYRNTKFSLLEIGLGCGMSWGVGVSAALWREYFGPTADIHFLEYDKQCGEKWLQGPGQKLNVTMHYGSQDDRSFLKSFAKSNANTFDAIIDDGGHRMTQQINSLSILLPAALRSGGTYAIEDIYTSYLSEFDGEYLKESTLIEFLKHLIDDIQSGSPTHKNSTLGLLLHSFEISDKICLFTKK
ncbi:unnamed protein product [Adineta steineri]|uniref:Uncharacterized protein n=1 Tax=Adineta steineri TaxID=433720 RepID=A0A814JCH5_9BILA|nr:unnamed protein product [Adineta steineri]CAF1035681.1 unnamed protein product [Adineta steineri]CAF1110858.1 unnamed protein product [Adineta steineri]